MPTFQNDPIVSKATGTGWNSAAIHAENENQTPEAGVGLIAKSHATGLRGEGRNWCGVVGESFSTIGGVGVWGEHHANGTGVYGRCIGGGRGVWGHSETDTGVYGQSKTGHAVLGDSETGPGVRGRSQAAGVWGESTTWHGVYGVTPSTTGGAGVWGEHQGAGSGVVGVSQNGAGVYGKGGRVAGYFEGDVEVTGDIRLLNAGDCAEDFDIAGVETVEPGTVMVLGEEGTLEPSGRAYDKRVAGVVSGAGGLRPGIVLDKRSTDGNRSPIALLGKVYCKVDAGPAPVEVGDLLTTSDTPGHAMKAGDSTKAFGSVIGKALRPLRQGQGLIPVLIALQ